MKFFLVGIESRLKNSERKKKKNSEGIRQDAHSEGIRQDAQRNHSNWNGRSKRKRDTGIS